MKIHNMLEDEDIKKLKKFLATKKYLDDKLEDFATRDDLKEVKKDLSTQIITNREEIGNLQEDVDGLREQVQALTTSIDNLVKGVSDLKTEYSAITSQINRHEKWIKQIAEKVGVKLKTR